MYLWIALALTWAEAGIEWFMKHDLYTAVSYGVVVPLALLTPRLVYRIGTVTPRWRRSVESIGFVLVLLNVIGTAFFHTPFFWADAPAFQYDRFLHLASGFLLVPLLILFWVAFRGVLGNERTTLSWAIVISLAGLFGWEGWQYFSDVHFGSHSFFDYSQTLRRDFWEDVVFGAVGVVLAVPYVRRLLPRYRMYLR